MAQTIPSVHLLMFFPCSWLFPQIDAALHHGGAGTTGASLRGNHVFRFLNLPLTRQCSWYTYSYLALVWVSRDVAHPVIGADTSPQRPVFLGVQSAKARRMYQDLYCLRRYI
jgi:hypothetical protein